MPVPTIQVTPVREKRELQEFVRFPWRVYENDPLWVPPLRSDVLKMLDRTQHPFHEHGDVEYFLARRNGPAESRDGRRSRDGEVVGRIAAIVNHTHNEIHEEKTGFFGFFETLEDPAIAPLLFETAGQWLRERGMETMRGPASFSSNEEFGLLVDGFDSSPMVMMSYNPRYYAERIESFGFTKAKDLLAYYLTDAVDPERQIKLLERLKKRTQISTRKLNKKRFREEVELVRDIYNSAWEKNWGFVPMSNAEIDHMAAELEPVIDPEIVIFAEKEGKTVGFALALPDLNQALKKANGKLFPFGLIKIMIEAKKIHRIRVLTLGILPEHRRQGADLLLMMGLYLDGTKKGYHAGEFSWVLEDNEAMRKPLEQIGAKVYKTYRVYDYPLGQVNRAEPERT